MDVDRATRTGAYLILLTSLLVAVGCILYLADAVGWAQLLMVFASGTAGAACVLILEDRP